MGLLLNEHSPPYTPEKIQQFVGVAPDGVWGTKTEEAIRIKLGYPKDNTGRPWKRHRLIVGIIQMMLNEEGATLVVDGILGENTVNAAKAKQAGLLAPKEPAPTQSPSPEQRQTLWAKFMTYIGRA